MILARKDLLELRMLNLVAFLQVLLAFLEERNYEHLYFPIYYFEIGQLLLKDCVDHFLDFDIVLFVLFDGLKLFEEVVLQLTDLCFPGIEVALQVLDFEVVALEFFVEVVHEIDTVF